MAMIMLIIIICIPVCILLINIRPIISTYTDIGYYFLSRGPASALRRPDAANRKRTSHNRRAAGNNIEFERKVN